jgi:hypothetical protein
VLDFAAISEANRLEQQNRVNECYRDVTPINAVKPRPETCRLLTIRDAFFTAVSSIGLSRRFCGGFRCSRPTSTKKSRGAIPPFSGRLVQPRKVSQITKAASLAGMASLFELDDLGDGHRANAFESPVQHRPPAYGVLTVMGRLRQSRSCYAASREDCHAFSA